MKRFQWVLASAWVVPCRRSCLWFSWTGSQGAARGRRVSGSGTSELRLCSLQMMWFCWLHQTATFSAHWGGLQPSVKQSGWESVPSSLRLWFSAGKRWIAPSGLGVSLCPKRGSLSISGSCSRSEGKMEREMDRQYGAASAVIRALYRTVVVKRGLSQKAKLSIYQSIFVPTLTYGHELCVVTERMRSRIQVAEMSFLRRVAGLSFIGWGAQTSGGSSEVEPLLLRVERGQLRWFGHLIRMPPGRLPLEVFRARPTGKRPRGRPRTHWRDYISGLAWERLGVPQEELDNCCWGRGTSGISLLSLHAPATQPPDKFGIQAMSRVDAYGCEAFSSLIYQTMRLYATPPDIDTKYAVSQH